MQLNPEQLKARLVHIEKRHARRARGAKVFRLFCLGALSVALLLLAWLISDLAIRGAQGFRTTTITLEVTPQKDASGLALLRHAATQQFSETQTRAARLEFLQLLSIVSAQDVSQAVAAHPAGKPLQVVLTGSDKVQRYFALDEDKRKEALDYLRLSPRQHVWLQHLEKNGQVDTGWNWNFFVSGDSREPELAGMGASIVGSLWTLLVCLALAFPLGVGTAIYLEEFRPKGMWVEWVEVNINNLAAVPSIIFGLLGLSVLLNWFGMPRSSSLVGGLTLSMIILPTIIIATRTALRAVPLAIRDAARALGATELQTVWHHTLPLAMPGIMTGVILGVARAIGETAPLLMIGMVAFIADVPRDALDPATVMPVQIYLWASSPEAGFIEKTAAAIMVLLVMLTLLNALAIYWRKKFEIRW